MLKIKSPILLLLSAMIVVPIVGLIGFSVYSFTTTNNIVNNAKKLNSCYLEYRNKVYYFQHGQFDLVKKIDLDPKTFQALPDQCIGKDKTSVYFRDHQLKNADPSTFKVIQSKLVYDYGSYVYSADIKSVYYDDQTIENADPSTFTIIPKHPDYSQDKDRVFYMGKLMPGINPKNLTFLFNGEGRRGEAYVSDSVSKKVFFRGTEIIADGPSFTVVNPFLRIAKDKNSVYFEARVIPNFDPKSLKIIDDQKIIKDNQRVLYISEEYSEIKNVNAMKFKKYPPSSIVWKGGGWPPDICGDDTNFFYCNTGNVINSNLVEIK